jgi:hypothetical protein
LSSARLPGSPVIWKRRHTWIVGAGLAPILLFAALLLSAQFWLNRDVVKREVERVIARATGGKAQYERIELHFLPLPGAELSRVHFSLPGTLEVQAQSASVEVELFALLQGRVHPHKVRVVAPRILVQIDEPKPGGTPGKPFPLKDAEAQVRSVLQQIASAVPGMAAHVEAGRVELHIGKRPALLVERIDMQLDVTADTFSAKVACRSNLWEQFAAEFNLAPKDLSGDGLAELTGLQVGGLAPLLNLQDGWPVQEAAVGATLKWQMHGITDMQAQATIAAPKVTLQIGRGHAELLAPVIEVTAQTKGATAEINVRRLKVESPQLEASARFAIADTGGYVLESETGNVDVAVLQSVATALLPDVDWLAQPPVILRSGTITSLKLSASAATLADLFDLQALRVTGAVDSGNISLPVYYDVPVKAIRGTVSLEQGVLHVRDVEARLDKSSAHGGNFDMNLNLDGLPMHVDVGVNADIAEAFALARRVLPDRRWQERLKQVRQLEGTAAARVIVAGNVRKVTTRVDVSSLRASARHDLVPFPIRIAGGTLSYAGSLLSMRGLEGAIGQSTFAGVSAELGLNPPYLLNAQKGSAVAALEELFHWAAAQPRFSAPLEGVKLVSGELGLSLARLAVPVNSPEKLQFQVAITPRLVRVDAPRYGPRVQLDGGVFDVSEKSVGAKSVKVSALDAAFVVSGTSSDYRKGVDDIRAGLSGIVGVDALKWLHARTGLPKEMHLGGALTVAESSVEWHVKAGVAARGNVTVAGGPSIGFAVRTTPKRVEVEHLTVRDDVSDASFGGNVEGTRFQARFRGQLAGASVTRVFPEAPFSVGELRGDFTAHGDWTHPATTSATGTLQGVDIRLPPWLPVPLTIERLSVEAKDKALLVKSATLSSGETRVDVSGTVSYVQDKFALDADVRGGIVIIPERSVPPEPGPGPEAQPSPMPAKQDNASLSPVSAQEQHEFLTAIWAIPVSGTIRVDIGTLRSGNKEISPLMASISVSTTQVDLHITRAALCSISLSGEMSMRKAGSEATVRLRARDAPLENSLACLTNERLQFTGKLDADAEFSASGKLGDLVNRIQGTFSAVAKNGHINKFDTLAAVLNFIDLTELFEGNLPDLSRGGIKYSTARVNGRVADHKIHFSESLLDASGFTATARGHVDYLTQQVDLDVLVAPFKTLDKILSYIPILRRILGGVVITIPVHVSGPFGTPTVVPLGPSAVGSRLIDIISNTLKLPADFIKLITPGTTATPPPAQAKPDSR